MRWWAMLVPGNRSHQVFFVLAAAALAGGLALSQGEMSPPAAKGVARAGLVAPMIRNDAPAVVDPVKADGAASEGQPSVLEITVKPQTVPAGDLIMRVDLVDAAQYASQGAAAPRLASGTVAFFPPAQAGAERKFIVPIKSSERGPQLSGQLKAVVTLLPANAARTLGPASIEVVDARLR